MTRKASSGMEGGLGTSVVPIAVPWTNANYVACNGFHPLYRALFEGDSTLAYNIIDEHALASYLHQNKSVAREVMGAIDAMGNPCKPDARAPLIARELVNHCNSSDFWTTKEIPGDLEFHHTSPLADGSRPFIFHCESFLPIFMPFAYQGRGFIRPVRDLRALYGHIFSSQKCLGIFSHLPETLDQFRTFFKNPDIDRKLLPSRTGLSEHVFRILKRAKRPETGRLTFLFTSSANQNPLSFTLRGGLAVLRFADAYFRSGRDARFIFRATRPSDDHLQTAGIDVGYLRSHEGTRILWLEQFLSESEQLSLFARADVLLLPSANLHSVTIMQAMAAGAVPIVTDTYGPDRFVEHGDTGIILKGVRRAIWHEDAEAGIPVDSHAHFALCAPSLAEQMIEHLIPIADHPEHLLAMQERCRAHAHMRFSGAAFRSEFEGNVHRLWNGYREEQKRNHGRNADEPFFEKHNLLLDQCEWSTLFESVPQPVLRIETEHCRVFRLRNLYVSIRKAALYRDLGPCSVLSLQKEGVFSDGTFRVARSLMDLRDELYLMGNTGSGTGLLLVLERWAYNRETWAYNWLRQHPKLYVALKAGYFSLRRLVQMLSRPPPHIAHKSVIDGLRDSAVKIPTPGIGLVTGAVRFAEMWRNRAIDGRRVSRLTFLALRTPIVLARSAYWGYLNVMEKVELGRKNRRRVTNDDSSVPRD